MKSNVASEKRDDEAMQLLRDSATPRMDPFTERRLRDRVLRGELPARPSARRDERRRWSAALAVIVAAALCFGWWITRPAPNDELAWLVITPGEGAQVRRAFDRDTVRVSVDAGAVAFEVGPHDGRRLIVVVPDGEIEDLGTTFSIEVSQGRTRRIGVLRGAVAFRRPGRSVIELKQGESFDATDEPALGTSSASASAAATLDTVSSAPASSPTALVSAVPKPTNIHAPASAHVAVPSAPSTAPSQGDGEDDAYLRVVALTREGRNEEAKQAARDYLRRFPTGFRRVEMSRVAE